MLTSTDYAAATPDQPALVIADVGEAITYGQLESEVNRLSHLFRARGLAQGDRVAVMLDNCTAFASAVLATFHSGLRLVPINWHLSGADVAYIVRDSEAKAVITCGRLGPLAGDVVAAGIDGCNLRLMIDGAAPGWESYERAIEGQPDHPPAVRMVGGTMNYTSGTTGRPKGVLRPLPDVRIEDAPDTVVMRPFGGAYGIGRGTAYLQLAPLYHAAPLGYLRYLLAEGGTFITHRRFDPAAALEHIEQYRVTHSQWVPTMFIRMLRLPPQVRGRYDLSSHRCAIHSAAPCPADVKREMIAWWGPIIEEYFGASEIGLISRVSSEEWLAKPGTVGKAPTAHICDDEGEELTANQVGQIWVETLDFAFHNDPVKTAGAWHPKNGGWASAGDIGYFDDDGYLFLTDRKAFMIISGGVNIYPRIVEDALALHPLVEDSAVFGVPDPDMGEAVKAVVQLRSGAAPDAATTEALIGFLHERVGRQMAPRSIDYVDELPRLPSGKLFKTALRSQYWPK
jgi:fatty-acyl-CoA synthase